MREANERIEGIELLAGSEVNILPDGSLDYEDELLGALDWVIASVHTSFAIGEQAMTERMIAAIEHPLVDAIGAPHGPPDRAPLPLRGRPARRVFAAAARTGTMLEINGNPDRRDLSDVNARAAGAAGVAIVIDSDAHRIAHAREHALGRRDRAPRLADRRRRSPTRGRWPELRALRKQARQ